MNRIGSRGGMIRSSAFGANAGVKQVVTGLFDVLGPVHISWQWNDGVPWALMDVAIRTSEHRTTHKEDIMTTRLHVDLFRSTQHDVLKAFIA